MPSDRRIAQTGEAGKSKGDLTYRCRPAVLAQMPRSCNVLFDLLALRAGDGPMEAGLVELARATRLSLAQVHRALKRLEGAHLITWTRARGRGGRSRITLRWVIHRPEGADVGKRSTKLAGTKFSSHARDTLPPSGKNRQSPSGRRPRDLPVGERALAWAMAQVREDLRARPSIDPRRRAVVMAALGPAVHRALRRGKVRAWGELRGLVAFILARIDERRGLGADLAATRRWAEWCVREALARVQEERERAEATRRYLAELQRDAEEARRAWADPTVAAQVRRMIQAGLAVPRSAGGGERAFLAGLSGCRGEVRQAGAHILRTVTGVAPSPVAGRGGLRRAEG